MPVSYSSSDPTTAEIVGVDGSDSDFLPDPGTQKIRFRKSGVVTVTASQPGNLVYNAAPTVTQTLTVNYYNLLEDSISGMQWWFDANNVNADNLADQASENSGSGGFMWNDVSSNNQNAVQSDSSKFFTYLPGGLNGKGTILFDEADTLELGSVSGTKLIYAVIKQNAAQSVEVTPFGGNLVGITSGGKWGLKSNGADIIDSGIPSNNFSIIGYQVENGNSVLYVNGENLGESADSVSISALDKLGGNLTGEIAEVVAYNRVLPDLVREQIEGYLAHKWGLSSLLPDIHKYKVAVPAFGGPQEIEFDSIPNMTAGSSPFNVTAFSSSGLPLTFDSNDTTRATVSGNTITIVSGASPGKVGITATQTGDAIWFPVSFTQTFLVTNSPSSDQYITFGALPVKNALDNDFTLSGVSKGLIIMHPQVLQSPTQVLIQL